MAVSDHSTMLARSRARSISRGPGRPAYRRSGNTDQEDQHTGGQATLTRQTSIQEVRQHGRGRPAYRRSGITDQADQHTGGQATLTRQTSLREVRQH